MDFDSFQVIILKVKNYLPNAALLIVIQLEESLPQFFGRSFAQIHRKNQAAAERDPESKKIHIGRENHYFTPFFVENGQ